MKAQQKIGYKVVTLQNAKEKSKPKDNLVPHTNLAPRIINSSVRGGVAAVNANAQRNVMQRLVN